MERLRVRYTKEGKVRFVSARDLTSVWERALRRVDLPIAYSEGFTPHPKVSFPDALPVGVASTGEYAELTFAAPIDPGPALASLSATMPEGMRILTYQQVEEGAPRLARLLEATIWEVVYPTSDHTTVELLRHLLEAVLGAETATVTHARPGGEQKVVDIRPALVSAAATIREPQPADADRSLAPTTVLRALLRNDGPAVRPTDLHEMLLPHLADTSLPEPRLTRRVVQGRLDGDGVREALTGEPEPLVVHVGAAS